MPERGNVTRGRGERSIDPPTNQQRNATNKTQTHHPQTPLFDQDFCKDRLGKDDTALTSEETAAVMMDALTLESRGNGDIIEVQKIAEGDIDVRDVKLEALYPPRMPLSAGSKAVEEELKFMQKIAAKGMRASCG